MIVGLPIERLKIAISLVAEAAHAMHEATLIIEQLDPGGRALEHCALVRDETRELEAKLIAVKASAQCRIMQGDIGTVRRSSGASA